MSALDEQWTRIMNDPQLYAAYSLGCAHERRSQDDAIRAAVAQETERCAKIVARYPSPKLTMFKEHADKLNAVTLLAMVADAIRSPRDQREDGGA